MPPYLGEWWRREECGATTCFSLTQDLVTHLTVNLIPSLSILSPGRGVCVGGALPWPGMEPQMFQDDRVFTPLQLWIYADEERVGWGVMDPCYHSHTVCCRVLYLFYFSTFQIVSFRPLSNISIHHFSSFSVLYNLFIYFLSSTHTILLIWTIFVIS